MTHQRFETPMGDCGLHDVVSGAGKRLHAFEAYYRFDDRTWGITVWAFSWTDAELYCSRHGLRLVGQNVDETL